MVLEFLFRFLFLHSSLNARRENKKQVSDLIDETNCRGVETINGVTPDYGNNRTFNITGDGGINVETDGVDTLYINASALQAQYNAQQTAIATLFDMLLAAQMAIEMLGMEVVKSVNHVLPDMTNKNINFNGTCLTRVYGDGIGRVAIDYCDLIVFAQETFGNVSYDFTLIDAQLNQELLDMQTLLTTTNATVTQVEAVQNTMITRINAVDTVGNNINVTGGKIRVFVKQVFPHPPGRFAAGWMGKIQI